MTSKTIAIVAASGIQGSSVARTFLALPHWRVRCLTRDPSSPKIQALAGLGAEVVRADLSDPASLSAAFAGAHAIFVNTDYWTVFRPAVASGLDFDAAAERAVAAEIAHGKNAVDAAAAVPTLERFVYSALGPAKEASGGKFAQSHHWETKAAVVAYLGAQQPGLAAKTSLFYPGAYADNPLTYPTLNPATGEYAAMLPCPPSTRMPVLNAPRSTGPLVRCLVEDEAPGTKLLAYDSYPTLGQFLETWSAVRGKQARLVQAPADEISRATGFPLEILEGPTYVAEFGFTAGVPDIIEPGQLKNPPPLQSLEEYLRSAEDPARVVV